MDFFDSQDAARRNTRRLVGLFVLAVAAIVAAVYLAVRLLLVGAEWKGWSAGQAGLGELGLFLAVAAATLAIVAAGTSYKVLQLREGGAAVARILGGRPLDPGSAEPSERRLLNVVEEMAIAAGLPVPAVYLLDKEDAINAFAAGHTPADAVLGVSRGCLRYLTRDELQGVIGHELSHVLNGDMRLNLRLIGLLHGILVIALIGYWILRTGRFSSGGRGKKGSGGGIVLFGLALLVVGYVGVFFGRWIKSAVSRQRELLADAAAVQFTRTTEGIAGALKKIGGSSAGSKLVTPHAEQASHLFFADGLAAGFLHLFSTHPPLAERIRRLDPTFDGVFPSVAPLAGAEPPSPPVAPPAPAAAPARLAVAGFAARVGSLDRRHVAHAGTLLAALPAEVRQAAREPAGAQAVVCGLLLGQDEALRSRQLAGLAAHVEPFVVQETERLASAVAACRPEARLPLVELAMPALRTLSPRQARAFREALRRLVAADSEVTLFEYAVEHLVERQLAALLGAPAPPPVEYCALGRLGEECSILLSALARAGGGDDTAVAGAFAAGAGELAPLELTRLPPERSELTAVDRALGKLRRLAPRRKRELLGAAAAAVAYDGRVTAAEGELLRAIADVLDCPVPPLVAAEEVVVDEAASGPPQARRQAAEQAGV